MRKFFKKSLKIIDKNGLNMQKIEEKSRKYVEKNVKIHLQYIWKKKTFKIIKNLIKNPLKIVQKIDKTVKNLAKLIKNHEKMLIIMRK